MEGGCKEMDCTQIKLFPSSSDKNSNGFRGGSLHSNSKNDRSDAQASPLSTSGIRARSPLHEQSTDFNDNSSTKQRASLENDIELLQLRLQQERSMRSMLERAMGRASSTLSPGHRHLAQELFCKVGVPSCQGSFLLFTFYQTKDLISEIELLEEEVANREQHVLSLYRSIFENCVSKPSSQQNSVTASPAHGKHESRKHPSIISSAFCSSRKFPLGPLQPFSVNDLGKRTSNAGPNSLFGGKSDISTGKTSGTAKVREAFSQMKRTSLRSLKDHLFECPSKLSEEMVRCMAFIYCSLHRVASNKAQKKAGSFPQVKQPQREPVEEQFGGGKAMLEIHCISTNNSQFSRASYAINNYRVLVEQLEKVNVSKMGIDAQTAFWINVYNALLMHAYLAYGIPHGSLRRLALFHKAAYNIGGHIISANAIEQSIFFFKSPRIGWWLETIISTALRKKSGEERQLISSKLGLPSPQPLVCFGLCTGASSDPVLKVYTASNVKEELEAAKRDFLQANIVVKKSKKVFLPKVLERFAREASISSDELPKWVSENVDGKLQESIQKCMEHRTGKKTSQIIEWLPYSSRFRYVFSTNLTERPWWS
ncbi:DUF547 domain-containing protein/Lzipper-MIP1 domain-containing protein [Cucumis melo var. makuwa]|uniref:DUF547 domain-containing protein/Lzipper-MIP1 domain-containing protein n=1 Tax=Cucumis melo var. makuwa TaxID=1194695 RepID=A0A5A7T8B7_CUCMM|nr:DUF547 domain-containing protein/Lzipper-MIP1 domain-containing protein [Cucumis melo var. makuwa]